MSGELTTGREGRKVVKYNPEKGLAKIAVAEIGEKHWKRAKDPEQLFKVIKAKLEEQAKYVVWRDAHVVPSQERGGPGRGKKRAAELSPVLPNADPGKDVVKRWRKRLCKKVKSETVPDAEKIEGAVRKLVTIVDKELLGAALEDAQHRSLRICEQEKDGTIRGTEATGEFERYTPPEFIEAARKVLGGFDLDPASCEMAQATVQADNYYTAESNGLTHEWHGRIWLNPPYHRELGPLFIAKLVGEYEAGRVTAAIVLTNNCTDTEWCARIGPACTAICFPTGRIRFTTDKGKEVLPTQGQTFFYFGDDPQRFREVFRKIGWGVSPVWSFEEK